MLQLLTATSAQCTVAASAGQQYVTQCVKHTDVASKHCNQHATNNTRRSAHCSSLLSLPLLIIPPLGKLTVW